MNSNNILSGEELVKKGVTSLEANLPELGLKDVSPSGSWLEQKQIQTALEVKKHLIEVERIEKRGSLSQANWHEELRLAEVTQKVGGYWQFLGHNVGKILYLKPEEALFLMEMNCLQLNNGGVKVSLQQAYSLLLSGETTLLKYKVYASLSRIGYKVFQHKILPKSEAQSTPVTETNINISDVKVDLIIIEEDKEDNSMDINKSQAIKENGINTGVLEAKTTANNEDTTNNNTHFKKQEDKSNDKISQAYKNVYESYHNKLLKLKNRTIKQCSNDKVNEYFSNIPDLLEKKVVTLKVPEARFVPSNMKLQESYTINFQNLHNKTTRRRTYSLGEEVNNIHIRRLNTESNNPNTESNNMSTNPTQNGQCPNRNLNANQSNTYCTNNNYNRNIHRGQPQYMPLYYANSRNLNYYNFNMIFDNTLGHVYFPSPFQCYGPQVYPGPSYNYCNSMGMYGNALPNYAVERNKRNHFQRIKVLAARLKILVSRGNCNKSYIRSLKNLLRTYNSRYKTNLILTSDFEILTETSVVAKIDLDDDDDDDEPECKRARTNNSLEENLSAIKDVALELKELEMNGKATVSHRRYLSKLIKTFNDSYNVDYYMTPGFEILNREQISSIATTTTASTNTVDGPVRDSGKSKKSKKLRNPYNILKRLSESQGAGCSKDNFLTKFKEHIALIKENVVEGWLPDESSFGRIEIPKDIHDPLFNMKKTQLLYAFMKFKPDFKNWVESKTAFLENLAESMSEFSQASNFQNNHDEDCLVTSDCGNLEAMMEKLRIFKTNKDVGPECHLHIDFDVYNRNVEDFRKKNPPKPHFRVICLDEDLSIPSVSEIEALQSQYEDNVPIVFALVSSGSVSYLQVKPVETPIYTPASNF